MSGNQQVQQQQRSSSSQQQGQQGRGQSSGSSGQNSEEGQQQQKEDPHFARLASASSVLSNRISQDAKVEQATELSEVLNSSASGDYVLPHNAAWQPFVKSKTINLPDALFEEYNLLECRCYMGLFPEIERAWITVDHRLFLWDYQDGSGFTSFEEIQDVIVGVALVRPKPGIFIDSITHLLAISTPLALHLIGLSYIPASSSQSGKASFQLYILDLTIPTGDGRSITNIVGTPSGRIFGCSTGSGNNASGSGAIGDAGELYEVIYNSKEGLFSKKCYLVNLSTGGSIAGASWILPSFLRSSGDPNNGNHIVQMCLDPERELLYTRTRNNTIELWNLQKGKNERVASVKDVRRQAGMLCPGSPLLGSSSNPSAGSGSNFDIVGMEVINQKEGKGIGLVCITGSGVRLYFTHQRGGLRGYNSGGSQGVQAPVCLELVHVRLPPNLQQQQQQQQSQGSYASTSGNNISISCVPGSGGGFFLAANTITDDTDVLLLFSPDIGRIATAALTGGRTALVEVAGQIPIEGRTWAVAETSTSPGFAPTGQQSPGNELKAELASVGKRGKREFLFLTNMGMHVVSRQRPVDTLLQLLDTAPGSGRDAELAAFAETYGRNETCSMLLAILASSAAVFGDQTANPASYSGEVRNTARRAFFEIGGRAMGVQRGLQVPTGAATTNEGKVILSGRHEGLAIYFSRIVSSLMGSKIVVPATTPQNPYRVDSNLPDSLLMKVQRDLSNLRNLLEADQQLFALIGDQWSGRSEVEAAEAEQASVNALRGLLVQSIEAISFVLLLIDYKLPEVVASCPTDLAKTLVDMTYADLLTTSKGRDIARSLVSAIINIQIGQNLSVDAISDVLQQRCGSFCSADDVLLYKAIESIRKAKSGPPSERTSSLRESLRLFQKASSHLSSSKLSEVVQEYNSLRFQTGAIDLALTCADSWDSEERGLSWWRDGSPKNDSRAPSWEPRKFCCDRVLETLQSADDLLNSAIESNGPTTEADSIRSNAYSRALACNTDALHFALYDWHLERRLTDQLLEIRASSHSSGEDYLEQYLLREPVSLERYDLLWQYYARHYQHSKAASVLATLAESTEFPSGSISLNKRLEYLSLASSNAKSQFPNPGIRQDIIGFLTELDEKLEVGTVQVEIFRQIEELPSGAIEDRQRDALLKRLEERLFSISELYAEFAEPLHLHEVMLLIFHVSDHRDEEHIARTWEALIDQVIQDSSSDTEATRTLSGKLTTLARRFYPSDVALPLPTIVSILESWNLDQRNAAAAAKDGTPDGESGTTDLAAWVPVSLRDGGVPYELLFGVYDALYASRLPPFTSASAATSALLPSLCSILSAWLKELTVQGYSGNGGMSVFPANDVEHAVGRYLADSAGGNAVKASTREKLQEVQREIRRRF